MGKRRCHLLAVTVDISMTAPYRTCAMVAWHKSEERAMAAFTGADV